MTQKKLQKAKTMKSIEMIKGGVNNNLISGIGGGRGRFKSNYYTWTGSENYRKVKIDLFRFLSVHLPFSIKC